MPRDIRRLDYTLRYTVRVLLTGIILMRTGVVQADLRELLVRARSAR